MKDLKSDSAGKLKVKETIVVDQEPSEVEVASAVGAEKSFLEPAPDLGARYDVLDFVGSGGMGTVWKVYDKDLKETFAIKVLKPELLADDVSLKRFQQEARLATDLTHANIAAIFGPGEDSKGRPYIIMRYVEGESLAQLIERTGPLDPDRAMELFWQINDALAHSHLKGIVHRDIKPSNIIISRTESGGEIAQLVDFGISSSVHEKAGRDQTLTQTGNVLGSPRYMSPEQFLGQDVGPESDMYSLGCVLYEMLTGAPPFTDPNPVKLILQHLNEKPNAEVIPIRYRMLVGALLEKAPGFRVIAVRSFHSFCKRSYLSNNESSEVRFFVAIVPITLAVASLLAYAGGGVAAVCVSMLSILVIIQTSIAGTLQNGRHTIVDKTNAEALDANRIGTVSGLLMILLQPIFFSINPFIVPLVAIPITFYKLFKTRSESSIELTPTLASNRRLFSRDEVEVDLKTRSKLSRNVLIQLFGLINITLVPIYVFVSYINYIFDGKILASPMDYMAASVLIFLAFANALGFQRIEGFSKKTLFQSDSRLPSIKNIGKGFAIIAMLSVLCWQSLALTMPPDYKVLVSAINSGNRQLNEKSISLLAEAPKLPHTEMCDLARLQALKMVVPGGGLDEYKRNLCQQILKTSTYENNSIKARAYAELASISTGAQQKEYVKEAIELIQAKERFKLENPALYFLKLCAETKLKTVATLISVCETYGDLDGLQKLDSAAYGKQRPWAFYTMSQKDRLTAAIDSLKLKNRIKELPRESTK